MSDRQLLEQVYATQVILMREIYRRNDSEEVKKYNADLVDEDGNEQDDLYERLQADVKRMLGGPQRSSSRDADKGTNRSEPPGII